MYIDLIRIYRDSWIDRLLLYFVCPNELHSNIALHYAVTTSSLSLAISSHYPSSQDMVQSASKPQFTCGLGKDK
ncbi:75a320e2-de9a-4772-8876-4bc14e66489e [Sclerotinia trifoliorum]|uniref:75a320e2-de9a-4772-8876-4bc14e66489e n=1 Tax=Sclerotinia trifoliorum TaxID=28548 RepID=A0A8H2ZLK2_9HELO|nr:75a320e2-de9a-4772-8876-4bc14e66489e [Sclerotinia trifoliorum]